MRLTKTRCDAATYTGDATKKQRCVLWCSDPKGFGLRIYPSGAKSWVLSYRAGTRARLHKLGSYGVLTLTQARDKAKEELARIQTEDADPVRERREKLHAETMDQLWKIYTTRHLPRKKPRSQEEDRRNYSKHIRPRMGSMRVAEITRHDVLRLHHAMKDTPQAANRVLALLSKLFNLADEWGIVEGPNPCRHVKRYTEKGRKRYLSPAELARLAKAMLDEPDAEAVAAIRLLILTGCRKTEILTLKWSQVDLEGGALHLADTKTGDRTVYLSAPAVRVLSEIKRRRGSDAVFHGRRRLGAQPRIRFQWERIRAAAGLEDVRLHDLRHTYASFAVGGGLSLPFVSLLLGHLQQATTERYAHLAADPVRAAAESVAAELDAIMSGDEGEVVPFKR